MCICIVYRSTKISDFDGKHVLIIGAGNAAFETANSLKDSAATVRLLTRTPEIPLSFQTHYVGHARGLNLQFLDLYQLKSLGVIATGREVNKTGLFEYNEEKKVWNYGNNVTNLRAYPDKLSMIEDEQQRAEMISDGLAMLTEQNFDEIITCMGE